MRAAVGAPSVPGRPRRAGSIAPCLLIALVLATGSALASPWVEDNGYDPGVVGSPRPTVRIPRLETLPTLDDFVRDMAPSPAFSGRMAHVPGGFVQRDPEDGRPASQHTDVYLAYDATHLVAVFVAFDDEPGRIRANLNPRESIFDDEIVEIQLDTFGDRRRAYTFVCNPFGVQWDAIWQEGNGFDSSFDTVWDSRGRRTDRGYVVWMRIPFKSLRFPAADDQHWGFLLVRDIPRNNESSFYPRMSQRIEGRLNQAGTLSGLSGISPGRNLQVIPYATGAAYRSLDDSDPDAVRVVREDGEFDAGLDAKAVVRDRFVVDATVNPDFSQVESDVPQVTANRRFEVFFPERRPFFLENDNYFDTPIDLLFTRRIVDPHLGLRVTGKSGRNNVGVLWIDDEAPGKLAPPGSPVDGEAAEFRVLRWSNDVGGQSNVGLIYTERSLLGESNRVGGADARVKMNDHWVATVQWVESRTRRRDAPDEDGHAAELQFNRTGRHLGVHLHGRDYDDTFRTDVGFVPRVDQRDLHGQVAWTFWPEGERLISWTPAAFVQTIDDQTGLRVERRAQGAVDFSFRNQTRLEVSYEDSVETLRPVDFATLPAPRDYDTDRARVEFGSDATLKFGVSGGVSAGRSILFAPPPGEAPSPARFVDGDLSLTFRPLRRLRADVTALWSRLEDDVDGARIFDNSIVRLRANWQFDLRASLRLIGQYDSLRTDPTRTSLETTRRFNVDALFRYLVNPWTAVYLGYNRNEANLQLVDDGAGGRRLVRTPGIELSDARQVFVKVSYLFRL